MIIFGCDMCDLRITFNTYFSLYVEQQDDLEIELSTEQLKRLKETLPGAAFIAGNHFQFCATHLKEYQDMCKVQQELKDEKFELWIKGGNKND